MSYAANPNELISYALRFSLVRPLGGIPSGTTAQRRSRRWRRARAWVVRTAGRHMFYVETPDRRGVRPATMAQWGAMFEDIDERRVAETFANGARVSTVFLGTDQGFRGRPLLYETMVFHDSWDDLECMRYTTRAEAELGHAAMVARVESGEFDRQFEDEEATDGNP